MKIAPSLMNMSLLNLERDIEILDRYTDFYHVDIIDWHYVKNMCLSPHIIRELRKITNKPIEAHLYMDNIDVNLINYCLDSGATIITMPSDVIGRSIHRFSNIIHQSGAKVGIFLNPSQPISILSQYSDVIDQLIILSVDPGFTGQCFINNTYKKILNAKAYRDISGDDFTITVDGGCNHKNYEKLFTAGADALVLGRGLFDRDPDLNIAISETYKEFQNLIHK